MEVNANGLTPAETERLALLAEECAEVVQVVGKILRHGYESRNPLDPSSETNRQALEREVGHLSYALVLARLSHDHSATSSDAACLAKSDSVSRWLHHQDHELLDRASSALRTFSDVERSLESCVGGVV